MKNLFKSQWCSVYFSFVKSCIAIFKAEFFYDIVIFFSLGSYFPSIFILAYEHGIGLRAHPTAVAYSIFLHYYIPNDPNYILYNNHDNNELLSMSNFYFTESYLFYNQ